jgi:putative type I restriction enzyme specificity protein
MKESGIDWIGQIPEEWKVRPIKHIVETPVTDGPHETPVLYETGIPFLSAEAVKDGVLDFNFKRGYISLKDHDRFKKKISPKKDDIFIVKSGATTGNVGIVNTDEIFAIWSPLALIRCNKTLAIQKYIYFYLLSTLFKSQVEFNWSFGTQQNIGMGVIERIKVILPPVSEQQKIVEVLDKKTAQLDKVKALLEEQIQKLKDYRASLIYETVTKGLDKTVPMKDSGIDWIGQIPQGWEISKIRYLVTTRSEKRITDSSIPYIGLENIESQTGKFVETGIQVDKSENIVVEIGDVLFGKLRPYLRKYWRATFPSTASSEFLVFQSSELDMNFLYYAIQSDSFIEEVNTSTYGSKMPRASWEYIKNMKIAFPSSLVEQQKIADFLDKKTILIDKLIQIKNEQIDNINKQRQTLIYDYVTGKRRV